MALLVGGLLQNVYLSLDVYLAVNLLDVDGIPIAIHQHGIRRFVPPVDAPWIETHYDFLGIQSDYRRQMGSIAGVSIHSTERRGYLQLNIYQRARIFTQRYTTAATRDLVVAALPEGHCIAIRDYVHAVGDVVPDDVGVLILDGVTEHVIDTGFQSGMTQHLVECVTHYLEPFTRP